VPIGNTMESLPKNVYQKRKELLHALFTITTSPGRFGLGWLCRARTYSKSNYDVHPGDNDHVRHTGRRTVWCPSTNHDDVCHTCSWVVCCASAILDDNLHKRSLRISDTDHDHDSPHILIHFAT
jgi:hypothetical protein